ncbi:phosphatase PAP2 family protein [Actinoplanes sp. TBRC 11911]|nr:phosphatase PAP2 family protein [Actinoplanes sp. TBRC 11911]
MIGLGLLISGITAEDAVNRFLAGHRTGVGNAITAFWSFVGSTPAIIGVTVIAAIVLRLTLHRWREAIFLCAAVAAQAVIFFFTTLAIDRHRPAVQHLDESPPTSSFPSGHTSAATALYCGLAVVLTMLLHHTWAKRLAWLLVLVPLAVGASRLYRGMHHPTDVLSSLFSASMCLVIMAKSILDRAVSWTIPHHRRALQQA